MGRRVRSPDPIPVGYESANATKVARRTDHGHGIEYTVELSCLAWEAVEPICGALDLEPAEMAVDHRHVDPRPGSADRELVTNERVRVLPVFALQPFDQDLPQVRITRDCR